MRSTVTGFAPGTTGGTSVLTWASADSVSPSATVSAAKIFVFMVNRLPELLPIVTSCARLEQFGVRLRARPLAPAGGPHRSGGGVGLLEVRLASSFSIEADVVRRNQAPAERRGLVTVPE